MRKVFRRFQSFISYDWSFMGFVKKLCCPLFLYDSSIHAGLLNLDRL